MQEAWVGRSPGEGNGNPLQSSCLENPMDRGAWRATVHRITRVRHDLATTPPPSPHIPVSEMLKCETKVLLRIGEIQVHLVKAMVFPVVLYGCESWTIKKAERWRIDAFELWCWRRLLRVPWTARISNQSILKEISPGCSL